MIQSPRNLIITLFLVCLGFVEASAQNVIAISGFTADKSNPQFAYLSPIIEGLLAYDLTQKGGLTMVERNKIVSVLAEQEMSLTGLLDPKTQDKYGKLLGADWLIYGDFTILSGEVLLTVQLTDTKTGVTQTFRERDSSEHLVHHIAEQIIAKMTGRVLALADSSNKRSILSLKDDKPGSIAIFSRVQNAKIFIDDEFSGFTQGIETKELLFDNIPPGFHKVQIKYARDFGVIDIAKSAIGPFTANIEVRPGRRTAILDETAELQDAILTLQELSYIKQFVINFANFAESKKGKVTLPGGSTSDWSYSIKTKSASLLSIVVNDKTFDFELPQKKQQRIEKDFINGIFKLTLTIKSNEDDYDFKAVLVRTDLDFRNIKFSQ